MKKRILSIILCVAIAFMSIPLTATAANGEYTVGKGTGTNANTCVASNIATIVKNHTANDKVMVYVSNAGSGDAYTPFHFGWRGDDDSTHSATVTYTTKPGENKATIYSGPDVGGSACINLYGDSIYKNINITMLNPNYGITTSGHSLAIDNTVDLSYNGDTSFAQVFVGGRMGNGSAVGQKDATITLDGFSFIGSNSALVIGAHNGSGDVIPGNHTVISKNNSVRLAFSGFNPITFSKNVNILFENSHVGYATSQWGVHGNTAGATSIGGALQIIANGNGSMNAHSVYAAATASNIVAAGGVYVLDSNGGEGTVSLTNSAGVYTVKSAKKYVYAYDSVNQPKILYYGTDTLTVNGSGCYEIGYADSLSEISDSLEGTWTDNGNGTMTRGFKTGYYYLAPGGSGDGSGRSVDNAAKSMTALIPNIIADGYGKGDEVYVYVAGGEGATSVPASGLVPNFTWPWPTSEGGGKGEQVTTEATLIVTSMPSATAPAVLTSSEDAPMVVLANTIFKNIVILNLKDSQISTNGYDVTFAEDVLFKAGTAMNNDTPTIYTGNIWGYGVKNSDNGTVTIDNATGKKSFNIAYGDFGDNAINYCTEASRAVVINGGSVSKVTLLDNSYTNSQTVYNGNLSLVLNNASVGSLIVSSTNVNPVINGAIQFVANKGSAIPTSNSFENFVKENDIAIYKMNSGSSANGLLGATGRAGVFSITSNLKYAYAYENVANPEIIYYGEDIVSVEKAGKYTVGYTDKLSNAYAGLSGSWNVNGDNTITKGFKKVTYYVAPGGSGDCSGSSPENAARSITAVVNAINKAGFGANDVATIKVSGGEGIQSGDKNIDLTSLPVFFDWPWPDKYTNTNIVITSVDPENPATLYHGNGDGAANIHTFGNTTFKDINILESNDATKDFYSNGYDMTFENVELFFTDVNGTQVYAYNSYAQTLDMYVGGTSGNGPLYQSTDNTLPAGGTVTLSDLNAQPIITFGGSGNDSTNETAVIKDDISLVVNGAGITKLYLQRTGYSTTYKGDLNVVLNGSGIGSVALSDNAEYLPVIEGAIQIVANNGSILPSLLTIKNYAEANNVPYYLLNSGNSKNGALMTTETAGVYKVLDGYTAVATPESDPTKIYASEDGILNLPEGVYSVSMLDNSTPYMCNGKVISVYIPCKIDFAEVKPDIYDVEDKIFIGWRNKETGEYATSSTLLNIGDVLEAQYIDCTDEDFGISTEIRTVGADALRYIVDVKSSFLSKLPNAGEMGTISMPTDTTRGRDIYLDEVVVYDWQWDEETKSIFTPRTTSEIKPTVVKAENLLSSNENGTKYTLCITNITQSNYNCYYMARGYIKYVDNNGVERVAYTDHANTSMYHMAVELVDNAPSAGIKAKLQAIVDYIEITEKNNMLNSSKLLISGYEGCADKNPNHKIYVQNGIYVRDISIDAGKKLSSPITIAMFSDPHLQHINNRDLEIAATNTLSSYRGRGWTNNGYTGIYLNNVIQYAKHFDMSVVAGDIMDFQTYGSAEAMERMLVDKYTPGKMLMACGNHEIEEILTPDMGGLEMTLTFEQRVDFLKGYWGNDIYYASQLMKDSEGNDGAIVVTMFDGHNEFYEHQKPLLEADIKTAREKGIPLLIFVHIPLRTKNPNETSVYLKYGRDAWGTASDHSATLNFADGFIGKSGSNQATLDVYNLIVQNYDVVKGVFHAHEHANLYTEIMAQDKDGNFIKDANGDYIVIPQHGVNAIAETAGNMISITIE